MWLDPSLAPGVLFCDVGCQNGLPSTGGGNRTEDGGAKVFTGKHQQDGGAFIQREEPRPPREGRDNGFIISPTHML